MTTKLIIGLDGHGSGERALDYGCNLARLIGDCELVVVYIIEWSPYSFQTPEENAERHKRRDEEISTARDRIIDPAVKRLTDMGLSSTGVVRHGNVADVLNAIAGEQSADQIIVARSRERSLSKRIFGGSTANLVMEATIPVTVVG